MEFIQFHPTCLFHPKERTFLISEALRGAGAKVELPTGEEFLHIYDSRAELAPRDIVARSIDFEMKKRGPGTVDGMSGFKTKLPPPPAGKEKCYLLSPFFSI